MDVNPLSPGDYLTQLAAELTVSVLQAVGRKIREKVEGTPSEQALIRCYHAGAVALLPPDTPGGEILRPLLRDYFTLPQVSVELAQLVRGNSPDPDRLIEAWEDETHGRDLPPFDFKTGLAACIETFLRAAEQESALQDTIQTAQARDAVAELRTISANTTAIAKLVEAALKSIGYHSGDITADGNMTAENIVTGTQININLPSKPEDPCVPLLTRYLTAAQTGHRITSGDNG